MFGWFKKKKDTVASERSKAEQDAINRASFQRARVERMKRSLETIIEQQTDGANATVRRMALIAKASLYSEFGLYSESFILEEETPESD